jgi:hypothetical protein
MSSARETVPHETRSLGPTGCPHERCHGCGAGPGANSPLGARSFARPIRRSVRRHHRSEVVETHVTRSPATQRRMPARRSFCHDFTRTDHKVGRIRQRPARGHTVVSICTAPARIETSVLLSRSVATALTRNGSSGADYIASKGAWLRGDERRLSHSRRLCRVILCSRVHRSGEPSDVLGRRRLTRQKGPNSSLRERNMK